MEPSFQDLLKRVEQLSDQIRELKEGVQKAVRIAGEDPEMALTRSRNVLEHVIRDSVGSPQDALCGHCIIPANVPDRSDASRQRLGLHEDSG